MFEEVIIYKFTYYFKKFLFSFFFQKSLDRSLFFKFFSQKMISRIIQISLKQLNIINTLNIYMVKLKNYKLKC